MKNIRNACNPIIIVVIMSLIIFDCKNPEKSFNAETESGSLPEAEQSSFNDSNYDTNDFTRIPVLHTIGQPIDEKLPALPFHTSAHSSYLNDPLVFSYVPDGGILAGTTAVVGSDVCRFYPIESISLEYELEKLPEGELIPFATIIPLGDKLESGNPSYGNTFKFEDNYNYFYKTSWGGKDGIVFGADLYGIGQSNERNRISALLYKNNGHFSEFYPVTGYDEISLGIQKELGTNGLAIQEVKKAEYRLSPYGPYDDMISLYESLRNKGELPVFVTTDLAAHANHLVFDRMLQYIEEFYFFPKMVTLTNEYVKAIEQKKGTTPVDVYNTCLVYFQTAKALLELAPQKIPGDDYYQTTEYREVNAAEVLRQYPQSVVQEIEKMNAAGGFDVSSVFSFPAAPDVVFKEDYSQYKVRGHYTKNGVLGAYFRALMWYGRINFNLGADNPSLKAYAEQLAPVALFITDITENSPELKSLWSSLFDPITELIGASDDIGFYELSSLWNKIRGNDFLQWYNDPAKREAFISKEYLELHAPSVSGSSLFLGPYAGGPAMTERLPPVGWRLFGQRYTLDSEIHHMVSSPRIFERGMVRGLDIMKVFGSKTADKLLGETDYLNPKTTELKNILNSLQQDLGKLKDDYWLSTYYTNILYQIKTQALFENGAGFYFTEKPGWNLKAMNSAHGTWAELRHDTILYVKQSYAERGGDGDWGTFRTKPLPKPIHYIEPNIPFWITSALGMQKIYTILDKYDYMDGKTAKVLTGMFNLFVKAAEISKLEASDEEVSGNDLTWILRMANELEVLVLTHASGDLVEDVNSLRMALAADVFTNAETGLVLETAIGIPYRLYIPLNDKQGGKRIAMGYGFSYYEFPQPMSDRLNNAQWRAIVYRDNPDMRKYLPFWMEGKVQPAK